MIVGLGNPGPAYANTRHNVGFMVVDEIARRLGAVQWKTKDRARQALVRERDLLLVQPLSFMNESGVPARLIASWYRIQPERLLVVYDELDLPFGRLRMRASGTSAGHNGMKSIIKYFGQDVQRLRIGIGRGREESDAIDRVLGGFTPEERTVLGDVIGAAADAAMLWADQGLMPATNFANAWKLGSDQPESKESNQTGTDDL
ncbi:MAG: aminoacyl-tRNA hydrolase [Vulcanimicrobiaceae bacterium]